MNASYEMARDSAVTKLDIVLTEGCSPHFHHNIEVLCVVSGEVAVTINEQRAILHGGDMAVSGSYDVHAFTVLRQRTCAYALIIPKNYLNSFEAATKNSIIASPFIYNQRAYTDVKNLIVMLRARIDENNELFKSGVISAIMGILSKELKFVSGQESDKIELVRAILNYIYLHFADELTLNSIAKNFGYTPNYFSHIFNSYIKMPLKDYINSIRAENAASLLKNGETIISAAMNSGYNSMRTFYRVFRERYKMTPNEFLESM